MFDELEREEFAEILKMRFLAAASALSSPFPSVIESAYKDMDAALRSYRELRCPWIQDVNEYSSLIDIYAAKLREEKDPKRREEIQKLREEMRRRREQARLKAKAMEEVMKKQQEVANDLKRRMRTLPKDGKR